MLKKWSDILCRIKEEEPLIHCIMGPISINQCANGVLAMGARPIMAEHPGEVRAITKTASALLLNLSGITNERMKAMIIAAKTAKERRIPIVIDAVGCACSSLRRRFVLKLLRCCTPALVKGNASEIMALVSKRFRSSGVDCDKTLTEETVLLAARVLAKQSQCVVLVSGRRDVVTDGKQCVILENGVPELAKVTGTGCLLGALAACCIRTDDVLCGSSFACALLGIAGEMAETDGNGHFLIRLMDALSNIDISKVESRLKMEVKEFETV